ncbi:MAG: ComEC/Rec2 family competence protein [Leptolyngbya sp.]|nr:ComEC/Rec2 family competence protein [Leptolyngbya sp.]
MAGLLGCGAYVVGLFVVSLWVRHGGLGLWAGVGLTAVLLLGLGGLAALTLPQRWRRGPRAGVWLGLGGLGLVAALNYGWQYPSPSILDISHVLTQEAATGTQQEVWGRLLEMPRESRSGKGQLWLQVQQTRRVDSAGQPQGPMLTTEGKLYVTVPIQTALGLHPGQEVRIRGQLYAPSRAKNPNAFDFQQYLASRGVYAGLSGQAVTTESVGGWGLWSLRQRIVQAQAQGLGPDHGALVSAMALGRRAVQVPYPIQDAFIQAGLAHTLAASGFHVSLLLGLVMGILRWPAIQVRLAQPGLAQLGIGSAVLVGYVLMTGAQPSVMRAALMGLGVLVGLALERRTKPLGCLLLAVTILLLWNPIWIDDVGFRLSVMATLGLMVTVQPLTDRLGWLPPTLATLLAVPLAAYFWTIPLALYYFNTLTTYSVVLNMVVTPLVMVISLGGMISGVVALAIPPLGSALAAVLWIPTSLLMALVHWEIGLPGSTLAMGHIALWQMLGLYGLYGLGGWTGLGRRRRWLVALLVLVTALGPLWYRGATLTQAAVLAAGNDAVMVVQDHQSTLLINSGTQATTFYTVGPFLRQAGINHLTHAIAGQSSDSENWQTLMAQAPIQRLYHTHRLLRFPADLPASTHLGLNVPLSLGSHRVESLSDGATALRLTLFSQTSPHPQTWLLLSHLDQGGQRELMTSPTPLASDVLWWDGQPLQPDLVAAIHPQVAIASSRHLDPGVEAALRQQGIQVWCTERDGAVLWHPRQGYQAYLSTNPATATAWD